MKRDLSGIRQQVNKLIQQREYEELISFLNKHLSLGGQFKSQGKLLYAYECYELIARVSENLLELESVEFKNVFIKSLNNLGSLLRRLGRFDEARARFEQSLTFIESFSKSEPHNSSYSEFMAKTCNNLGNLEKNIGRFKEAKTQYEQALKKVGGLLECDQNNASYQSLAGQIKNNLAILYRLMGEREESKVQFEETLANKEDLLKYNPNNLEFKESIVYSKNNFAVLLEEMGLFEEANTQYKQALGLVIQLLEITPENVKHQNAVAAIRNNLGLLLSNTGKYEEAQKFYIQALEIYEKFLESDSNNINIQEKVVRVQNNIGNLYIKLGHLEDAKVIFEKILSTRKALLESDPNNVNYLGFMSNNLNSLGRIAGLMNRPQECKERFEQSLEIGENLQKTYPNSTKYQAGKSSILSSIGIALSDLGRYDEAEKKLEQALSISKALLKNNPDNIKCQQAVAQKYNSLGNLLFRMDTHQGAKKQYEKALDIKKNILKYDQNNSYYSASVAMTSDNLGSLLREMGSFKEALYNHNYSLKLVKNTGQPDLLYNIYLGIAICHEQMGMFDMAYRNYQNSIEQVELIRSQFSLEEYKLDILKNKTSPYSKMISFLAKNQKNTEKAWYFVGKAKSRGLLDFMRFAQLSTPRSIPTSVTIEEEKLLYSIKIKDRQARTTENSERASALSQEITGLNRDLDQLYENIAGIAPEYVELRRGQPLSYKGIAHLLNQQNSITVFVEYYTTDEEIFIFVLKTGEDSPVLKIKKISKGQIESYQSSFSREITNHHFIGLEENWQEIAQYLIDPIWDIIKNSELLYIVPHGLLHYLPLHALKKDGKRLIEHIPAVYLSNLTQLKYTQVKKHGMLGMCLSVGYTPNDAEKELLEGEAQKVAELLNANLFLGQKATKNIIAENGALDLDVIHLSCHGYFNTAEPFKSGIRLYDGMLTVKDIFNMKINTNLLVLSACQTGINEQKPGDELIGLTRAFLYAGVKSIIVSLWPVNAAAATKFMISLYSKIKDKKGKVEALQLTQKEMIKDNQYSHPYYWAPFILIGDWN